MATSANVDQFHIFHCKIFKNAKDDKIKVTSPLKSVN